LVEHSYVTKTQIIYKEKGKRREMFRLHKKAKGSATKASSRNKLIEIR
jgi:hypothetical protein